MRSCLFLLIAATIVGAQTPPLKQRTDAFFQERSRLQKAAKTAFDSEMSREKAGACPKANSTRDINECLGKEIETSTGNYNAYSAALRAMLAQENPWGEAQGEVYGPTGKPQTRQEQLSAFDQVELAWMKYRDAMCSGEEGLYKGGTIMSNMGGSCQLMMLRSHMRELAASYGEYLSH